MGNRRELKLVWFSPIFRGWDNGIKKRGARRIFLFSMKTSSWHWSTGVPFPIGCLNLWPFRAQKHGSNYLHRSRQPAISFYIRSSCIYGQIICACMCVLSWYDLARRIFRFSSSSSSLLLVEFSFYTHTHIYKFDLRFDEFFHGVGYERLIFLLLLISHRRERLGESCKLFLQTFVHLFLLSYT